MINRGAPRSVLSRAAISLGVAIIFHTGIAFALSQQTLPSALPSTETGNFEVVELPTPAPAPEPTPEAVAQPELVPAEVAELKAPVRKPRPPVKESLPKEEAPAPKPETANIEIKIAASTTAAPKDEAPSYVPPDSRAAYLQNPHPVYPAQARRKGLQGVVLLTVEVSAEGLPLSLAVKESSGVLLLDNAAVESVRRWKFVAATRGGKPVAAFVEIPIRFLFQNS